MAAVRHRREGYMNVDAVDTPLATSQVSSPVFSVATATYNRANTLPRVYDSLRAQTFQDFEWLIVDDGSVDETPDLVKRWHQEAAIPIRYFRQENRGKAAAMNRAVREARGQFFLILDSDDACIPTALERFLVHWDAIPLDEREMFQGVTARCMDQHGNLFGDPLPAGTLDSNSAEMQYKYKIFGERWGFQRIEVLRRFPFPVAQRGGHVQDGVVWRAIGREYRTRYVDEALRVYWRGEGGRADQLSHFKGKRLAEGAIAGVYDNLAHEIRWFRFAPMQFLMHAARYVRYSLHLGVGLREQVERLDDPVARALWAVSFPLGLVRYFADLTGVDTRLRALLHR
jgi:glycosyltransferase involved in cell wall biosynthesis